MGKRRGEEKDREKRYRSCANRDSGRDGKEKKRMVKSSTRGFEWRRKRDVECKEGG